MAAGYPRVKRVQSSRGALRFKKVKCEKGYEVRTRCIQHVQVCVRKHTKNAINFVPYRVYKLVGAEGIFPRSFRFRFIGV